jgi:uncharacterized glyoxalase superfamily protein PhnB
MAVKKTAKRGSSKKASVKKAKAAPAKADSLKMNEVSPAFTVNDLQKSLAWYRDVLGFALDERWEQDGKLMGVSLRAGGVTFMIAQDDWKKGRDRKKGEGFRLYCGTTQNVDAMAKRIEARGGKLDSQPTDQPWGTRDFGLTDPDGFKITIGADPRKKKK